MKEVSVKVSKEAHEVAEAVSAIVIEAKKALADGFQAGADLPAILLAAFGKLTVAIEGLDKLGEESKDLEAFINAFSIETSKIVGALLKKEVA